MSDRKVLAMDQRKMILIKRKVIATAIVKMS